MVNHILCYRRKHLATTCCLLAVFVFVLYLYLCLPLYLCVLKKKIGSFLRFKDGFQTNCLHNKILKIKDPKLDRRLFMPSASATSLIIATYILWHCCRDRVSGKGENVLAADCHSRFMLSLQRPRKHLRSWKRQNEEMPRHYVLMLNIGEEWACCKILQFSGKFQHLPL